MFTSPQNLHAATASAARAAEARPHPVSAGGRGTATPQGRGRRAPRAMRSPPQPHCQKESFPPQVAESEVLNLPFTHSDAWWATPAARNATAAKTILGQDRAECWILKADSCVSNTAGIHNAWSRNLRACSHVTKLHIRRDLVHLRAGVPWKTEGRSARHHLPPCTPRSLFFVILREQSIARRPVIQSGNLPWRKRPMPALAHDEICPSAQKSPLMRARVRSGGMYETRTRDLRRDRPAL